MITPVVSCAILPPDLEPLLIQADEAERHARLGEARVCYEKLLHSLKPNVHSSLASALLRRIARTYVEEAAFEVALDCLEAALAAADAAGDVPSVAHAVNLMAIANEQWGKLDDAVELYERARESALACGEDRLVAMIEQNLGTVAAIRGDFTVALQHYRESLEGYRRLGLDNHVGLLLNNLGLLYTDMRRWRSAERAFGDAFASFVATGDAAGQIGIKVNKAKLFIARQQFGHARELCEGVLARACEHAGSSWIGEAHKHLGVVCREMADYATAEEHLRRAENIAREREDLLLGAETAREQAELFWRLGRNRDTLQHLNHAHQYFSRLRARVALADIERRNARLEERFLEIVRKWGDSIESKDRYTQGHCERVADVACALARRVGFDQQTLFWFRIGALLHDVGKLIIPAEILNRRGPLTDEQWALMNRHPVAGVELLGEMEFPWDIRPMVRNHHERWDGTGYPDSLAGDAIPFAARILGIADVYDALTTTRSYRLAFSHEQALELMRAQSASHFDPMLLDAFLELHAVGDTEDAPSGVRSSVVIAAA